MENQGFYLKSGEFAGKTTSLDIKLHVKKKKPEAAQDDRNLNYEHLCLEIFRYWAQKCSN